MPLIATKTEFDRAAARIDAMMRVAKEKNARSTIRWVR